eukprot:m.352772 g.352772  ORF g.352772 m.352772 type:complete len:516 (+) comp16612_c0_seq1:729-2276(+)
MDPVTTDFSSMWTEAAAPKPTRPRSHTVAVGSLEPTSSRYFAPPTSMTDLTNQFGELSTSVAPSTSLGDFAAFSASSSPFVDDHSSSAANVQPPVTSSESTTYRDIELLFATTDSVPFELSRSQSMDHLPSISVPQANRSPQLTALDIQESQAQRDESLRLLAMIDSVPHSSGRRRSNSYHGMPPEIPMSGLSSSPTPMSVHSHTVSDPTPFSSEAVASPQVSRSYSSPKPQSPQPNSSPYTSRALCKFSKRQLHCRTIGCHFLHLPGLEPSAAAALEPLPKPPEGYVCHNCGDVTRAHFKEDCPQPQRCKFTLNGGKCVRPHCAFAHPKGTRTPLAPGSRPPQRQHSHPYRPGRSHSNGHGHGRSHSHNHQQQPHHQHQQHQHHPQQQHMGQPQQSPYSPQHYAQAAFTGPMPGSASAYMQGMGAPAPQWFGTQYPTHYMPYSSHMFPGNGRGGADVSFASVAQGGRPGPGYVCHNCNDTTRSHFKRECPHPSRCKATFNGGVCTNASCQYFHP